MPEFSQVKSYSSSYSNINGREDQFSRKYIVENNNGKKRGKIYRGRGNHENMTYQTKQLDNHEIDDILNINSRLTNPKSRQYGFGLDLVNSHFSNSFLDDPFFKDF